VDIIKENMFFVVMGVVVLIALALFVVVVRPGKVDNERKEVEMNALRNSLDRLVNGDKILPTVEDRRKAEQHHEAYVNELVGLEAELSTKQLGAKLPDLAERDRDKPGAFKTVYMNSIEQLRDRVRRRGISAKPEAWKFWDWKEGVPDLRTQGVIATKEYFLIRELVAIITIPALEVKQLDRLEVNSGETRSADYNPSEAPRLRVEPYFDVYPFILEVRMPVRHYELLLEKLLISMITESAIPVYVRSVSMMRIEDDPTVNQQPPPLIVGIRVEGWALDYEKKEKSETTRTPVRGLGRPN